MAEKSYFFDAVETGVNESNEPIYDRVYQANDFASYFSSFVGNGVYMGKDEELKVVPKSGMTVTIRTGKAFIDGYLYENTENKDITLSINGGSTTRTDVIICKLDKSLRKITVEKREGVSSDLPVNSGNVHELVLATITIASGQGNIGAEHIRDTRALNTYCGYVQGVVQQIQTESLYSQMLAQFNNWFDTVKGQLSTDAAGSLQNQVNSLNTSIGNVSDIQVPDSNNVVEAINNSRTEYESGLINLKNKDIYSSIYPPEKYDDFSANTGFGSLGYLSFNKPDITSNIWSLSQDKKSVASDVLDEDKIFLIIGTVVVTHGNYGDDSIMGSLYVSDENQISSGGSIGYHRTFGGSSGYSIGGETISVSPLIVKAKKGSKLVTGITYQYSTPSNTKRGFGYGEIMIVEL